MLNSQFDPKQLEAEVLAAKDIWLTGGETRRMLAHRAKAQTAG